MSAAIFSAAARWTRATQESAASPRGPTIRQLRRNLRQVRSTSHSATMLSTNTPGFITLSQPARSKDQNANSSCCVLRKKRTCVSNAWSRHCESFVHSLPRETRFRCLIRWILLRWRISWTLALLDRIESRRSRGMLEALTQLSRVCPVIAAARIRPNQFFTRLSSYHPDDP